MGEITAASQEQSTGIEQVNHAVAQMDQVTQQNAALVEEAAAASGSMQEQARALAALVAAFRVDGHGLPLASAKLQPAPAQPLKPATPSRKTAAPVQAAPKPLAQPARKAVAAGEEWEEF